MVDIINSFLESDMVSSIFKIIVVRSPNPPKTITSPNTDFQPSLLRKILERVVATQLYQHMANHELYEPLLPGFRKHIAQRPHSPPAADSSP